jgi:hypothetical protein
MSSIALCARADINEASAEAAAEAEALAIAEKYELSARTTTPVVIEKGTQ